MCIFTSSLRVGYGSVAAGGQLFILGRLWAFCCRVRMFSHVVFRPNFAAYFFINVLSYRMEFFSTSGAGLATRLDARLGVVGNFWARRGRQACALNAKDQL